MSEFTTHVQIERVFQCFLILNVHLGRKEGREGG